MFIPEATTLTDMAITTGPSNTANTDAIMGIYTNSKNQPKNLVGETAVFTCTTPGDYEKPLKAPVVLERGLYWIALYKDNGLKCNGFNTDAKQFMMVRSPNDSNYWTYASGADAVFANGVRSDNIYPISALPVVFTCSGSWRK